MIAHVLRPTSGGPARALGVDDCPKDVSFKGFKILLLVVGVMSLRGWGCTAPFGGDSVRLLSVWRAGPGCSVSLSLLLCHVVRGDAVKTRGCRWRVYVKLEKFRILYDSPAEAICHLAAGLFKSAGTIRSAWALDGISASAHVCCGASNVHSLWCTEPATKVQVGLEPLLRSSVEYWKLLSGGSRQLYSRPCIRPQRHRLAAVRAEHKVASMRCVLRH